MKNLVLVTVAVSFSLAACSSPHAKFEKSLEHGQCEAAAQVIPQEKDLGIKIINSSQQVGGTLLSYGFTGASYTAEVLWDIAGGTAMFVALCGPTMVALSKSATVTSPSTFSCIPGKFTALQAPPLGARAFNATKDMRCPPVTPLSRSIRRVASCYQQQPNSAGVEKARQSLKALRDSGEFFRCLTTEEQQAVDDQIRSL